MLSTNAFPLLAQAQFADNFATDSSLNTSLWTNQSSFLTTLAAGASSPGSSFLTPILSFGTNGMQMSGVTADYQFTGISSLTTFTPPFTLTTTVMGVSAYGNPFYVYLVNNDLSQWLTIAGNVGTTSGAWGIWIDYTESGVLLSSLGIDIFGNPSTGVWYTIQLSVDASGNGAFALTDINGNILASQSALPVGTGPFYVALAQREGLPAVSGPNVGIWRSANLTLGNVTTNTVNLFPACINGLQVDINGGASPGASVTIIDWNWGDGQRTNGFFPQSHSYAAQGQYTVQVTAHYSDGSSTVALQTVNVAPGVLSGCEALTISAEQGGSVSYSASVGTGVVIEGASTNLLLAYADDLSLTATACPGNLFTNWSVSAGMTGTGSSPVDTTSGSIAIVVIDNAQIAANFTPAAVRQSPKWSGYVVGLPNSSGEFRQDAVDDVKGAWIVPPVQEFSRGESYATWIGIGGWNGTTKKPNNQVHVHIGTMLTEYTGQYEACYEVINLPHMGRHPIRLPLARVQAGDIISAEIAFVAKRPFPSFDGWYRLTIENVSRGISHTEYVVAPHDTRQTAEWIIEDPLCHLESPADFGTSTFASCSFNNAPINRSGAVFYPLALFNPPNGPARALPSPLSCDGTSFSVTWQHH
jgi:hypothetical protein